MDYTTAYPENSKPKPKSEPISTENFFNKTRKVGPFEIKELCYESYPCKHSIRKNNENWSFLNGYKIYTMLKNEGISDPHFEIYSGFK